MTKAEIEFKGHRIDFYWKKGAGYFVIIRNFYVGLVDKELDGIKTLSQAKKAVEKEFK